MRDGQKLTYADLKAEARGAVDQTQTKQTALAEMLGVSQGAVSHALSREGSRYASLQVRILEALTDFALSESEVKYVARRKD